MIKKFMEIGPDYFHLQDSFVESHVDKHLHFGSGNMDLPEVFRMIPNGSMVCIETGCDMKGILRDIDFLINNI